MSKKKDASKVNRSICIKCIETGYMCFCCTSLINLGVCIVNKQMLHHEGMVWFLSSAKTLFDLLQKNKRTDDNFNKAYNILENTGDKDAIEHLRNKRVHFCTERIKYLQNPKIETREIVAGVQLTSTDLDFQDFHSSTVSGLDALIGCRISIDKWLKTLRQIQPLLETGAIMVQEKYGYGKINAPNSMGFNEFVQNKLRESELLTERMCGLK